ncbi:MAG: polysaccharide deacetylase family protein, partial [Atopobiaceae bacterium]|nr:polysaccharide deacetylase family protein [Atopobiaceae bacterium]
WTLPGADAIVTNATSGIQTGYVILMHDGGGNRDQDVEALPRIIETLQQQGYEFVTISELMASDESIPEECAAAFNPMPEDALWTTELG